MTTKLLDGLYDIVEKIWDQQEPLTEATSSHLLTTINQIRGVSVVLAVPVRPTLPVATTVEGLLAEHVARKKKSTRSIDLELDLDELAAHMEERREKTKIPFYHDCELPQGVKAPKASLGRTRVCLVKIGDTFVGSWELVATEDSKRRMADGIGVVMCNRVHHKIPDMQACNYAHTIDRLEAILEGRVVTAAEIARQAVNLPQPVVVTKAVVDGPLTYTTSKGTVKNIELKDVMQNSYALEAMRDGRGRECMKEDPHNSCSCSFVHPLKSKNTLVVVTNKLYVLSDLHDTVGKTALTSGQFRAGTVCTRAEKHDHKSCKFIHLKDGVVAVPQPTRSPDATQSLADAEAEKAQKSKDADRLLKQANRTVATVLTDTETESGSDSDKESA